MGCGLARPPALECTSIGPGIAGVAPRFGGVGRGRWRWPPRACPAGAGLGEPRIYVGLSCPTYVLLSSRDRGRAGRQGRAARRAPQRPRRAPAPPLRPPARPRARRPHAPGRPSRLLRWSRARARPRALLQTESRPDQRATRKPLPRLKAQAARHNPRRARAPSSHDSRATHTSHTSSGRGSRRLLQTAHATHTTANYM